MVPKKAMTVSETEAAKWKAASNFFLSCTAAFLLLRHVEMFAEKKKFEC